MIKQLLGAILAQGTTPLVHIPSPVEPVAAGGLPWDASNRYRTPSSFVFPPSRNARRSKYQPAQRGVSKGRFVHA